MLEARHWRCIMYEGSSSCGFYWSALGVCAWAWLKDLHCVLADALPPMDGKPILVRLVAIFCRRNRIASKLPQTVKRWKY